MMEKKKITVEFAPGAFDNFEGTQDELQELIAEIHRLAQSGEMFERAKPLTEEEAEEILGRRDGERRVQ
jgi:hypothetical protein